jgi:hypothetical protein
VVESVSCVACRCSYVVSRLACQSIERVRNRQMLPSNFVVAHRCQRQLNRRQAVGQRLVRVLFTDRLRMSVRMPTVRRVVHSTVRVRLANVPSADDGRHRPMSTERTNGESCRADGVDRNPTALLSLSLSLSARLSVDSSVRRDKHCNQQGTGTASISLSSQRERARQC